MTLTTYYSANEVAEILGITPETVRRWIRRGTLPAVRIGRISRIDADDLERAFGPDRSMRDLAMHVENELHMHTPMMGRCMSCDEVYPCSAIVAAANALEVPIPTPEEIEARRKAASDASKRRPR